MSGTTLHRPVIYRKKKGTLLIDDSSGIQFQVDQGDLSEEWPWARVAKCLANPASSEKSLLKLRLAEASSDLDDKKPPTFSFATRDALEEARRHIKACLNGTAGNGDIVAQAAAAANNGDLPKKSVKIKRRKKKKIKSTRNVVTMEDASYKSDSSMDFSESTVHHLDLSSDDNGSDMDDSRASQKKKTKKKPASQRNVMGDDSEASVGDDKKEGGRKKSQGSHRGMDESQSSLAADGPRKKTNKKKSNRQLAAQGGMDESQSTLTGDDAMLRNKPKKKSSSRQIALVNQKVTAGDSAKRTIGSRRNVMQDGSAVRKSTSRRSNSALEDALHDDNDSNHAQHRRQQVPVVVLTPSQVQSLPTVQDNRNITNAIPDVMEAEHTQAVRATNNNNNKGMAAMFLTSTAAGIALAICCCCICCILLPIIIYVIVSKQAAATTAAAAQASDDYYTGPQYAHDYYSSPGTKVPSSG